MRNTAFILGKNELLLTLRHFSVSALCVFFGVCLLVYPNEAKSSINRALEICGETVIASLFPFMFLSSFITQYGLTSGGRRVLDLISKKLFGMRSQGLTVFLLSALGGFPVGAKTSAELLEANLLSESEARRLIFSCVNPSPSFAVSAVGLCIFGSAKTGVIIYSSVVLSNLILFFLSRFIFQKEEEFYPHTEKERVKFSTAFVNAGRNASEAVISICCYVLLFSCICDMAECFIKNQNALAALSGFLEVTIGCQRLSSAGNVPLIAGVIGWAGMSVHFQIMDSIEKSKLDLKLFFASRTVCAFLSVFICDALLKLFPTVMQTVSLRSDVIIRQTEKSISVSVMMLLACFIFLIGDCTVKIGKSRYSLK